MRSLIPIVIAVVLAGTVTGVSAQVAPIIKPYYLRGAIGVGGQSLGEVNRDIRDDQSLFAGSGAQIDTFGPAIFFSLEAGRRFSEKWSLGLALSYQRDKVNNLHTEPGFSYSNEIELSVLEVTGNASYWIPNVPGLFAGGALGMAWGKDQQDTRYRDFTDPSNDFSLQGDYGGTGLVIAVFGGYEYPLQSGIRLFATTGYQHRNFGELSGDEVSTPVGLGSGSPVNNAGAPVDFDLSGLYLKVGAGIPFGSE